MNFKKPKGTKDILPKDIYKWHYIERIIREVSAVFNFSEIRTPTFENTELFKRGVGNDTDIVGKEMYTFEDKSGDSMTLKPEGTAPVMRALIENSMINESPFHKLFYITNMFRHEKPQAGRFREHTQFGAEIIGSNSFYTDVELILMAKEVYNRCGIENYTIKINSIGKPNERKHYINVLKDFLANYINDLSEDSKRRFETNTLRILDSKDKNDRQITENAPKILDTLGEESKLRFNKVINELENLKINYEIDFRLVRGLDYYTDTTFEFVSQSLGSQDAIGGGGRYDMLIEQLGGKETPGAGFGSGIERIIIAAEKNGFTFGKINKPLIYFIALNDIARMKSYEIMNELRAKNIPSEIDLLNRSFKAQMRDANRLGVQFVYIVGDDELEKNAGQLKNMENSSQYSVPFSELAEKLLEFNK
ncbi:MAG: histidine--tRNA ligase [Ignavibacteria bacterium]|nr:histidine--tRNA ligase [Ignavibacteria bacterium]